MRLFPRTWRGLPRARHGLGDSDVFAGFLCLYLFTASRSVPFGDATPMWEAAEGLVHHFSFAIETRWPVNAPPGRDGHYYPVAALLACLVHVPGALLQILLNSILPGHVNPGLVFTSQLGPLILGALAPMLFFRLLKQIGYDLRQAAVTTLLLGTGTSVWVYAHRPYSEILQVVCFIWFLGALLRAADQPTRGSLLRFGLAAALLVNSKNVYFACLPGAGVYLCWRLRGDARADDKSLDGRAIVRALAWVGVGFAPGIAAFGAYNQARWGSVLASGYGPVTTGFWRENILVGLWGQFLSPGKSVFLYSPPLVLALFGIRRLVLRRPHVALAIALIVAPVVLIYSRYVFWSGDWAWGPRYLVFALPALLLPVAELFGADSHYPQERASRTELAGRSDEALSRNTEPGKELRSGADERRSRRALMIGVVAVSVGGVGVQVLGNAYHWSDFINVSIEAQHAWLGRPNVAGTPLAPDPCFSCFEHLYPAQWLPPMQPIAGHWWLLRHQVAGHDWRTAEADAPWKRYTSLTLDIHKSYDAVDVDWWLSGPVRYGWLPVLLIGLLLALAVPVRPWIAAVRGGSHDP